MSFFELNGTIPSVKDFRTSLPKRISALGTPIFDDITFPGGIYVVKDTSGKDIGEVNYSELSIISGQVAVSSVKNIIETPIAGRNGTIKEYVSTGDYSISISGKITEALNLFPADYLDNFVEIMNISETIPVESKFLNEFFNIQSVIIKKFNVSTVAGSMNEVDISIEMVSDVEINLNDFIL